MGVVLDSTILIGAERAGQTPRKVIEEIAAAFGVTEATLSVVTVIELAHGVERADTIQRRNTRERFLEELLQEISPEVVSSESLRAKIESCGRSSVASCWPPPLPPFPIKS